MKINGSGWENFLSKFLIVFKVNEKKSNRSWIDMFFGRQSSGKLFKKFKT
jgi:hypothetical protein